MDKIDSNSLTRRVIGGAGWNYSNKILSRLLTLIRMIVLARLLTPEDFGLFAIVTLSIATLQQFSTTGIDMSLIHQKEETEICLDVGWTIEIIRGVLMALVLLMTAPAIAWFFDDMRIIPLLQVMCIVFSLNGFTNIGVIYFRKELKFHKQFILDIACALASLIVGIFLAYELRSVWALVLAELARVIIRCALSYIVHPYRPSLNLDAKKAKKMLAYGKWVFASNVAIYGGSQLDNLMVGKILGTTALGIYSIAYNLSLFSIREVTYTLSEIAFPSYAKLQDDQNRLTRGFDRIFQLSTFLSIPACIGIAVIAPVLVNVLLGHKWQEAIVPLQILMIAQLIKSVVSTGSPLFMGVGRPNYEFHIQLARTVSLFISLYPLIYWLNLSGAAWAVVVSAVVMLLQFIIAIVKVSGFKIRDLVKRLLPSLICSIVMAFCVMQVIVYINISNKIAAAIQLAATIITGALIYLLFFYFIARWLSYITVFDDIKIFFKQLLLGSAH